METASVKKFEILKQFINQSTLEAIQQLAKGCDIRTAVQAGSIVAETFGDRNSYDKLTRTSQTGTSEEQRFITSFYNNLNLLIEKTWIEKTDEVLKEQVQYRLNQVYGQLKRGDYSSAYPELLSVLYDALYLMFGADTRKPEFIEYALRIDPCFGIFWWFMFSMPDKAVWPDGGCRIIALLVMLFIANY